MSFEVAMPPPCSFCRQQVKISLLFSVITLDLWEVNCKKTENIPKSLTLRLIYSEPLVILRLQFRVDWILDPTETFGSSSFDGFCFWFCVCLPVYSYALILYLPIYISNLWDNVVCIVTSHLLSLPFIYTLSSFFSTFFFFSLLPLILFRFLSSPFPAVAVLLFSLSSLLKVLTFFFYTWLFDLVCFASSLFISYSYSFCHDYTTYI